MDNSTWLQSQIEQLRTSSTEYKDQAFYLALQDLVALQHQRLDQVQRELDGRMWQE